MPLPIVPLCLSEATFSRHLSRSGGAVADDAVISTAARIAGEVRQIVEISLQHYQTIVADETLSEGARLVRAKQAASKLISRAAVALDAITDKTAAEIAKLKRETDAPPAPALATQLAQDSEMRGVLRDADTEQRSKLLAQGGDAVWRALLTAPSELSGMTSAELEGRRTQYRRKAHPQGADRLARLLATQRDLQAGATALVDFAERLFRPARRYEAAAAAANQVAQ